MIWCIKTYTIAYVKIQKKWRYTIQYVKPTAQLLFKVNFQKVDQHAGGNWLIHDTKRRKDNQLRSLKLPIKFHKWIWQRRFKKIDVNLYIDLFRPYLGPKNGPKFLPTGDVFHKHMRVPTICLLTKFHGPVLKLFLENGQRPPKFPFLPIFCN